MCVIIPACTGSTSGTCGVEDVFMDPDEEFQHHVHKVKHCEILDDGSHCPEQMLANFGGMEPWEKGIDVIEEVMVNHNQLQETADQNLQDVTVFTEMKCFELRYLAFIINSSHPSIKNIALSNILMRSPCDMWQFW